MSAKKTVHLIVEGEQYLISDLCTGVQMKKIVGYHDLTKIMDETDAVEIIQKCVNSVPELVSAQKKHGQDAYYFDIYTVTEIISRHYEIADEYVEELMPLIRAGGGDSAHFDYLPASVEVFIEYCVAIDYLEPIQRLYDSLWTRGNAYYPPSDDDPRLYKTFEIDGINLHRNHPRG